MLIHQTSRWSIAEDWYQSGKPGWFADPQVPGGAFIDEGIYWIDLFRWLTGSEITHVDARMANLVHKDICGRGLGDGDLHVGQRTSSPRSKRRGRSTPRARPVPRPKQNSVVRLEVVGTRGEIIDQWFRSPGRAVLAAGAADWVFERQSEPPFAPAAPFPLSHLIDCLDQNRKPVCDIREAGSDVRGGDGGV